jgi:hypothetical protein
MSDTLREFLERSESFDENYWSTYQSDFAKLDAPGRTAELALWHRLMEEETKPDRVTAELISKRRSLADLDNLLRRAGR